MTDTTLTALTNQEQAENLSVEQLKQLVGLVEYDGANNLGIYLGLIPVEDLFYTVFVCLVVTALWPGKAS